MARKRENCMAELWSVGVLRRTSGYERRRCLIRSCMSSATFCQRSVCKYRDLFDEENIELGWLETYQRISPQHSSSN